MRRSVELMTVLLLFGPAGAVASEPEGLIVPILSHDLHLDGVLSPEEWEGAVAHEMERGGKLHVSADDRHLRVAVSGPEEGWAHVYLAQGDHVAVLHASAALGRSLYRRGESGSEWMSEESFEWSMRETGFSKEELALRDEYLRQHGWVANTARVGTDHALEFRIDRDRWSGDDLRLAVVFASDPEAPAHFPVDLADDTLAAELIFGKTPDVLHFDPSTWMRLRFVSDVPDAVAD
jgi:hypothetical protein